MKKSILSNNSGFMMVGLAISLVLLAGMIYVSTQMISTQKVMSIFVSNNQTKMKMLVARNSLSTLAADPDGDLTYEPLAPRVNPGNGVAEWIPLSVATNSKDEYGTEMRYCAWDLGTGANANATYSLNRAAPPISNLAMRVVSAGQDLTFQTACAAASGAGDDMVIDVFLADIISIKGNNSAWSVSTGVIGLSTSSDVVSIGGSPGAGEKLHVQGNVGVSGTIEATAVHNATYAD